VKEMMQVMSTKGVRGDKSQAAGGSRDFDSTNQLFGLQAVLKHSLFSSHIVATRKYSQPLYRRSQKLSLFMDYA
jgi:hypothetical protein